MQLTGYSLQIKRNIQTESKGIKKDIPCKQKQKENWGTDAPIKQNTLKKMTKDIT